LSGRPATVVEKNDCVIVGLRSTRSPSLPKGLPQPAGETNVAVFIARKQWAAVARALKSDPQDALVIEGYPYLHPRFSQGITVCATMVTTVALQAAKRQAQREAAGHE